MLPDKMPPRRVFVLPENLVLEPAGCQQGSGGGRDIPSTIAIDPLVRFKVVSVPLGQ